MLKKSLYSLIILFSFNQVVFGNVEPSELEKQRQEVIKQYIQNLGNANRKEMANLFEKNGIVVTPFGFSNAKEFYYTFFPTIRSSSTEYKISFSASKENKDAYAARFRFKAKLKNGKNIDAESVDQYIFSPNSTKLKAVYMFENVHFPQDINQH